MEPSNNISQEVVLFQIESLLPEIKYNFLEALFEEVPTLINMISTSRQWRAHAADPVGKIARVIAQYEAKKSGKAFEKAFHFFEVALQAEQNRDKVTAKKGLIISRELAMQIRDESFTESLLRQFSQDRHIPFSLDRLKKTLEEDCLQSDWDSHLKNSALSEILIMQAQIGDLEEAQATLQMIQGSGGIQLEFPGALVELAAAQAKSGKMEQAEATIKNIQDSSLKGRAWSKFAVAQAQMGLSLETIQFTLKKIDDFKTRTLAWLRSALILEIPKTEILKKINARLLDSALAEIAAEIAKSGDTEEAEKIIGMISDQRQKEYPLILVALKKVLNGDIEGARKTLTEIKIWIDWALVTPEDKSMRLIWLGRALGQTGQLDEAKKMFEEAIQDAERISNVGALVDVSLAQAQCGDQVGANATLAQAQKIVIDGDHIGLIKIGRAYDQLGDLNQAKTRIKEIKSTGDSNLKTVAIALAGIGDIDGAKETINRMTNLVCQVAAVGALFRQRRETFQIKSLTK